MGADQSDYEKGEPVKYDPAFKGPIKDRSCTDILCCLLFCICFLGMIAVAALAFARGDPTKLLYPTDSDGNLCGSGNFVDKPNLFFFDLVDCAKLGPGVVINGCPTPQACVKTCPSNYWNWVVAQFKPDGLDERRKMYCLTGVNPATSSKVCVSSCPATYWAWYASIALGDSTTERQKMICKSTINALSSSKVCVEACPHSEWMYHGQTSQSDRQKMICKIPVNPLTSDKVCVSTCPESAFTWAEALRPSDDRKRFICRYHIDPQKSTKTIKQLVEDEDCAAYYVDSTPIVGRCIPSIFATILNKTTALASSDGMTIRNKLNETISGTQLEEGSKYLAYFLSAKEYGVKIYQDVRAAWWMILIGLGLSMIVSFIWIIIMRWLAAPMVWLTLIAFMGLFGFATYYCINKYIQMKDNPDNQLKGSLEFTTNLSYYWNLAYTWLVFGCIAGALLLIVLIIIIFLRKRILIAIALIKESSRAVAGMIFTLFWPIIPFIMEIVLFGFWGASAIYLASSGSSEYEMFNKTMMNVTDNSTGVSVTKVQEVISNIAASIPCDQINPNSSLSGLASFCNFVRYGGDEYTIYLQIYQLFMLFWCMNFIVALGQMTLAGAFASYYWALNKPDDIPTFPLAGGFWRSIRYHLGSLAFGSLIIAIIQLIRVFLEYLDQKLKGSENKIAQFFLKCLKCCFWCLEKFMRFLNKNAYIMIAIYGKNFCVSAKNAFMLILRNVVRVAVVDKVTDFLLFVGKLVVVGAVGTIGYLFFSGTATTLAAKVSASAANVISNYVPSLNFYLVPVIIIFTEVSRSEAGTLAFFFFDGRIPKIYDLVPRPELSFTFVPVLIICIGSYIIAAAFFSVYGMAVDTLFLCFLEDLERHDGSAEKPYYMSKELMKLLGKKNKAPAKDD